MANTPTIQPMNSGGLQPGTEASHRAASGALLRDLAALVKLRLSSIVVFSAGMGYILAAGWVPGSAFAIADFVLLLLGGLLVTASANALNEVIERDTDALMQRTADRPLPTGRMAMSTALLVAGLSGVGGVALLWYAFQPLAALLGALSLLTYAFIYTPMKRLSPLAVFVGAIPGAIPPMIGWVAISGTLTSEAIALFAIQFFWQFPHFWAIAWLGKDDYARAGFDLLPDPSGTSRATALHIVIYTALLVPVGLLPYGLGISGWVSAVAVSLFALFFTAQAVRLYQTCAPAQARSLLFGSFFYLPAVLVALALDQAI
jgi:protoheme IX farnesyltransferase